MSYLTTLRRAQAESQPAVQTAAPTAADVPAKAVEAIAAQVIDHVALSEQVAAKWAPVAAGAASDPLAAPAQPGGDTAENHGWGSVIASLPTVAGAIKIEVAPNTPQAAADWAVLK